MRSSDQPGPGLCEFERVQAAILVHLLDGDSHAIDAGELNHRLAARPESFLTPAAVAEAVMELRRIGLLQSRGTTLALSAAALRFQRLLGGS